MKYPVRGYSDALFDDLADAQRIDFSFLEKQHKGKGLVDPLPDTVYEPAHKKAERLERSIRNSEKGRAQHEKDQIIRLLEGLKGHDWLRIMGVSGITESRKKSFEPARRHFIKGCKAILEKFRIWSEEEKRRKLEKERLKAKEQAEEDEEDEAEEEGSSTSEGQAQTETSEAGAPTTASSVDPPDSSDVDASIAKQLEKEAIARSKAAAKKTTAKQTKSSLVRQLPTPPEPPPPPKEFTSFFEKKYQRDAALSKGRRRGRTVLAWGHAIPEPEEQDFVLPEEYRDEETLKTQARRRRRDKRGHWLIRTKDLQGLEWNMYFLRNDIA